MPTSLVVEDNKLVQMVHKRGLEEIGYKVDIAETGGEALVLLAMHNYDLVLMDISLPDKTGIEVIKNFRQSQDGTRKNTRIIVVTTHVNADVKKHCFEAGCDLLLSKPIAMKELEKHLLDLCPIQD